MKPAHHDYMHRPSEPSKYGKVKDGDEWLAKEGEQKWRASLRHDPSRDASRRLPAIPLDESEWLVHERLLPTLQSDTNGQLVFEKESIMPVMQHHQLLTKQGPVSGRMTSVPAPIVSAQRGAQPPCHQDKEAKQDDESSVHSNKMPMTLPVAIHSDVTYQLEDYLRQYESGHRDRVSHHTKTWHY